VRNVSNLLPDLNVRLNGVDALFEGRVEGQRYSGLEVANAKITSVPFKEVYEALPDAKKKPLNVAFGKNIDGRIISADFNDFPHILVAGTTGSGKSVFTHSVICTLIMRNSPENLKLVLIDPKKVEMSKYRDIPHLLCPIINDPQVAKLTLDKLAEEMNRRYDVLENSGCSDIKQYNELRQDQPNLEPMPFIVIFIDEYADIVDTCKEVKQPVVSIAQKARACGIHMLIATQRPSTNVIDGVIKGNLPTRVALAVAMQVDSVTILGEGGAEKLLGRGDMLVQSPLISRTGRVRLQSCYIQNKEILRIVGYLKEHYEVNYDPNFCNLLENAQKAAADVIGSPEFLASQENSEEEKYQSVKEWVMANEYMSMSRIQRECSVGFNRAGRFFKRLQDEGIVDTETEGNKGCPVLVHDKFYDGSSDSDVAVSSDQSEVL
jgi:S-DNA-T family DNA segregation ATPase FtsK/SpoIIIE